MIVLGILLWLTIFAVTFWRRGIHYHWQRPPRRRYTWRWSPFHWRRYRL